MRLSSLLLTASYALASTAARCGNELSDNTVEASRLRPRQTSAAINTTYSVDLHIHVVSTTANATMITDSAVAEQIQVLQDAFALHGFTLVNPNISRVVDDYAGKGFYTQTNGIDDFDRYLDFLKANRRGGYDALNVYFFSDLFSGLSGSCNMPTPSASDPEYNGFWQDGCILNANTMPGMPATGSDSTNRPRKGHVAVHEVGHWFGLFHTFHGRMCDLVNDQVDDTPAQSGATAGCPIGRDSCPDRPGLDPIHNYMDYSDDECSNGFTAGQGERMRHQFSVYRRSDFYLG